MTLTGTSAGTTTTDALGNYTFSSLPSGGNYAVTPSKTALAPGATGINGIDAVAVQRHFLQLGTPLAICRLTAGDVNVPPNGIGTTDAVAIQRFFLTFTTGIAQTGQYTFSSCPPFVPSPTPCPNLSYTGLTTNQIAANFDALILGDVASAFVHRPEGGPAQDVAGDSASEVASTVAAVALPDVAVDQLRTPKNSREQVPSRVQAAGTNFSAAVTTSAIEENSNLVGFQGDFTFDERVVTFQGEPVSKAGLTSGNWNVSGKVLAGAGPIRTLRIMGYSNDFVPLRGEGTLFNVNLTRVSQGGQGTPLIWAAGADQFIFIDADLKTQKAGNAAPGSVTASGNRR
jgi:hypothetical protein